MMIFIIFGNKVITFESSYIIICIFMLGYIFEGKIKRRWRIDET